MDADTAIRGLMLQVGEYNAVRLEVGELRARYASASSDLEQAEREVRADCIEHARREQAASNAKLPTDATMKITFDEAIRVRCSEQRATLLRVKGKVEEGEARLSVAREKLRLSYAVIGLTFGQNFIASNFATL